VGIDIPIGCDDISVNRVWASSVCSVLCFGSLLTRWSLVEAAGITSELNVQVCVYKEKEIFRFLIHIFAYIGTSDIVVP
jgi:hypothetical protein